MKPAKQLDMGEPVGIDRTPKNYVGGKQARPDGSSVMPVVSPVWKLVGEVGRGNRKDIRNAVEAAAKHAAWSTSTAHLRAQIIYYIGENLDARKDEFAVRLRDMTGMSAARARIEVNLSIERLFYYAGFADKFDGAVHSPPMRDIAIAMNEPLGILGIVCPQDAPLLGFVSLMAPAIAAGNRTVILPSDIYPLAATDFYQVLETSDVPAGVVNIVTGEHDVLTSSTLADHEEVNGLWYFGKAGGVSAVEAASISNVKQTWSHKEKAYNWNASYAQGRRFMEKASQVKNVWVPYGA